MVQNLPVALDKAQHELREDLQPIPLTNEHRGILPLKKGSSYDGAVSQSRLTVVRDEEWIQHLESYGNAYRFLILGMIVQVVAESATQERFPTSSFPEVPQGSASSGPFLLFTISSASITTTIPTGRPTAIQIQS